MNTKIIIMGGCGRMGRTLIDSTIAHQKLELAGVINCATEEGQLNHLNCIVSSKPEIILENNPKAVIVDFSSPEASINLLKISKNYDNPTVIGTTGFTKEQFDIIHDLAKNQKIFWAPNMSIGVNALLKVLPLLSTLLGNDYDKEIMEIHHRHKKDSPSGTALKLAQCLADSQNLNLDEHAVYARHGIIGERKKMELGMQALRGGDVVGDHTVYFLGSGERIEITHRAHSRETFAQGALRAAIWLPMQKTGKLYTMQDLMI